MHTHFQAVGDQYLIHTIYERLQLSLPCSNIYVTAKIMSLVSRYINGVYVCVKIRVVKSTKRQREKKNEY